LANKAILPAIVACLTSDRLTAAAIPITVASLLGQLDVAASSRAAAGLVVINLLGRVLASVAGEAEQLG
jgi:hypothetical protein